MLLSERLVRNNALVNLSLSVITEEVMSDTKRQLISIIIHGLVWLGCH